MADEALEAAKARFERGQKNLEAGKNLEAAADFEAAYRLTPRSDLLYDAGLAYDHAGAADRAVQMYQAYLRSGDNLPEEQLVKARLQELLQQVALVTIKCNEDGAQIVIDGKERGQTPMMLPVPLSSGPHRIEVRKGDLRWTGEQEFTLGLSHTVKADVQAPSAVAGDDERHSKRFVAVLGLGGAFDVTGNSYPPHQAALLFGADYRLYESWTVAVDLTGRIPVEIGNGWVVSGILPGVRVGLLLSQRVPLELVPSLDLGLSVLKFDGSSPPSTKKKDACGGVTDSCTSAALRIHPALGLSYRFLPNWEARLELFGLEVDIGSPVANPRITFGVSAAWRFY